MQGRNFTLILTFAGTLALASCAMLSGIQPASDLNGGNFRGEVDLRWENTSDFVYLPVDSDPLTYVFPEKYRISADESVNSNPKLRTIAPALMYTDGGSIPRALWGFEGLSPMDYLPAYVIHDWLYLQHRCHKAGKGAFAGLKEFPYDRILADKVLEDTLVSLDRHLINKKKNRSGNAAAARKLIMAAVAQFGEKAWMAEGCLLPPPDLIKTVTVRETETQTTISGGRSVSRRVIVTKTREIPRYSLIKRFSVD